MRVLVCGSRDYIDRDYLFGFLDDLAGVVKVDCIIEGRASGADQLAGEWAETRGVSHEAYPARWQKHGKRAGPIRNEQMLTEGKPDLVVAFPLPSSKGTWHMVGIARTARVTTWIMPQDRYSVTALGEGVFA